MNEQLLYLPKEQDNFKLKMDKNIEKEDQLSYNYLLIIL